MGLKSQGIQINKPRRYSVSNSGDQTGNQRMMLRSGGLVEQVLLTSVPQSLHKSETVADQRKNAFGPKEKRREKRREEKRREERDPFLHKSVTD